MRFSRPERHIQGGFLTPLKPDRLGRKGKPRTAVSLEVGVEKWSCMWARNAQEVC